MNLIKQWLRFLRNFVASLLGRRKPPLSVRLVIERHPNPDYATFHLHQRFTDVKYWWHGSINFDDLTADQRHIAQRLRVVEGIVGLTGGEYDFRFEKARAYSWDEIEPKIIRALRVELGIVRFDIEHIGREPEKHKTVQGLGPTALRGTFGKGPTFYENRGVERDIIPFPREERFWK